MGGGWGYQGRTLRLRTQTGSVRTAATSGTPGPRRVPAAARACSSHMRKAVMPSQSRPSQCTWFASFCARHQCTRQPSPIPTWLSVPNQSKQGAPWPQGTPRVRMHLLTGACERSSGAVQQLPQSPPPYVTCACATLHTARIKGSWDNNDNNNTHTQLAGNPSSPLPHTHTSNNQLMILTFSNLVMTLSRTLRRWELPLKNDWTLTALV